MPLIKCPECQKDISSEATSCPQCGHPIRAIEQPKEQTNTEPAQKTNLRPLGVFFLIAAVICAIGGFYNTQETAFEKIESDYLHKTEMSKYDYVQQFQKVGASAFDAQRLTDAQVDPYINESRAKLEKLQNERELRMIYFFVPAGLLGIIGLICCAKH